MIGLDFNEMESCLQQIDRLFETHLAWSRFQNGDDEVFGWTDLEERSETGSCWGCNTRFYTQKPLYIEQLIGILPKYLLRVGKGPIEQFALVGLLANYLPKNAIFHRIVGQESDVLRTRVGLLIH
jgi:hypothetical protein